MLVATPGQTASYSTLHNSSSNGGSSNSTTGATTATKKSSALNSTNGSTSGAVKSLNNNINHATSTVTSKNSLNCNTHSTTYNYHTNVKSDHIVSSKLSHQGKVAATSSKEVISSKNPTAANTHSLKSENSTKHQSFIQTLKESVQKALISTTGSTISNSILNKHSVDKKLKLNCNNSATSINNVTSSSSTTNNTNKVSTTTSGSNSSNSTAATQSSSSMSVARSKHFSCSLSKLHTVAPTVIHRFPQERQHASSTDSLQNEMCHFKPIRIVPKTPWKIGSKSRGNYLRVPKANLATTKTEFILKSNCDVNNRKKKQQQNRTQNDKISVGEIENDDNEQENKEIHGIYKPKPSLTSLTSAFSSPNHASAFVCLVAQMKNLVNMKSKKQLMPSRSTGSIVEETSNESLKELLQRKAKMPVKRQHKQEEALEEFTKIRSARLSSAVVKNKRVSNTAGVQVSTNEIIKKTNDKSNISKTITKAETRKKLVAAKLKTTDIAALSTTKAAEKLKKSVSTPVVANNGKLNISIASNNSGKRRIAHNINDSLQRDRLTTSPSTSLKSLPVRVRKSARLSTIKTDVLFKYPNNQHYQQNSIKSQKKQTPVISFSPPLTRSRLKRLAEQGKIITNITADIKKRKI